MRWTPVQVWVAVVAAVLIVSLATGYRASRAAQAPQYLFTTTRVLVERPAQPRNALEAEIEAAFAEAGEPGVETEIRPMFVLGLLDGALPVILLSGLACAAWSWRRRGRRQAAAVE